MPPRLGPNPRRDALEALRAAQAEYDTEKAHVDADEALCTLLKALGYEDVVAAWRDVSKGYC